MKTVKRGATEMKRVSDEQAAELVANQGFKYCGKAEWKARQRGEKVAQ